MDKTCRLCQNSSDNKSYIIREMMYGHRDAFEYLHCARCQCLSITNIPTNLNRYYPESYHSFSKPEVVRYGLIRSALKRQRTRCFLCGKGVVGQLLLRRYGPPGLPKWVMKAGLQLSHKILDVGCAMGGLLIQLRREGFTNTMGIDPFLKKDIYYDTGLKILKKNLTELDEEFDCVMLHHSFEHMADPISVFTQLRDRVKSRGCLLIRTPVIPCFAWRKYGPNWVQLDAPRHLFIHSIKSLNFLSQKAGFVIEHVEFDSTTFQFWGSEQYAKGISLYDPRSYRVNPSQGLFSNDEIVAFQKRAEELNNMSDGDQACFFLRRI